MTCSINKSFIISGAEDAKIVIARLDTGKLVMKIEQHRAAVTALCVCSASDVLVSGSRDATICLWSLDTFALLNMLQMNKPVLNVQISSDSVGVFFCSYLIYWKGVYPVVGQHINFQP